MRRCLRRSYRGSDHFGAGANNEHQLGSEEDRQALVNPSNTSMLTPEAISVDLIAEDVEHSDSYNTGVKDFDREPHKENHYSPLGAIEPSMLLSSESGDNQVNHNQGMTDNLPAIAPGYVPSVLDELVILELPASMVRPLKIAHWTFQITTKWIKFIADKVEGKVEGDQLDSNCEIRDELENDCWMMTSLHQIYSRRQY